MIRIVTAKTWGELQTKLASAEAKSVFLEAQGKAVMDKAVKLSDALGKVASWLTANLMAAGRTQRTLTPRDVAKAVGFDLSVEPGKDGEIKLRIIPKATRGLPLKEGEASVVQTAPPSAPMPEPIAAQEPAKTQD